MPTDLDRQDLEALLLQTLPTATGRHRRSGIAWRRTGPETWDLYRPGSCTCGRPDLEGLSLTGAAGVIAAWLEAQERIGRGGMQLA